MSKNNNGMPAFVPKPTYTVIKKLPEKMVVKKAGLNVKESYTRYNDKKVLEVSDLIAKGITHVEIEHECGDYGDSDTTEIRLCTAEPDTIIENKFYAIVHEYNEKAVKHNEKLKAKYGKELADYNKKMEAWRTANPELAAAHDLLKKSGFKIVT